MNDVLIYAALDHNFAVTCSHPGLTTYLHEILGSLRLEDPGDAVPTTYAIEFSDDADEHRLSRDNEVVVQSPDPTRPLAHLLHQINLAAIDSTDHRCLLHAAAVWSESGAVLLPGAMETGKSTLAAGLVRAGWSYLSDEAISLSPGSLDVGSFPRAISLDPGSWPLFDEVGVPPQELAHFMPAQRQVPPTTIGRVGPQLSAPAAVVLHRYDPSAPRTTLVPADEVEALRDLLSTCFTVDRHPDRDLTILAGLVERASCWQLVSRDLSEAVAAVGKLLAAAR